MYLVLFCLSSLLLGTISMEIQEKNNTVFHRSDELKPQETQEHLQTTELPTLSETMNEIPSPKRFRSDYKYIPKVDSWMKMHVAHDTLLEAMMQCHLEGTTLAAPTDKDMLEAMCDMVSKSHDAVYGVHTGIHSLYSPGDFHTFDGMPLHNLTVPIKKAEKGGGELPDCMTLEESELNFKSCEEQLPFICSKKNEEIPDDLGECTTVDPAYKRHEDLNSCYKFHPEPKKWSDAYKTCSAEGGYLAIPNNDEEVEHMKDMLAAYPPHSLTSNYKDSVLLGFRVLGAIKNTDDLRSHYFTIHGQSMKQIGYNRWSTGQPNRSGSCGGMYRTGMLNDIWCHVPYPFICEKDPYSY